MRLGIEIKPVWRRKNKQTSADEPVALTVITPDTVEIAEKAIDRLAVKAVIGAVIVTGATLVFATAGKLVEAAFQDHLNNKSE